MNNRKKSNVKVRLLVGLIIVLCLLIGVAMYLGNGERNVNETVQQDTVPAATQETEISVEQTDPVEDAPDVEAVQDEEVDVTDAPEVTTTEPVQTETVQDEEAEEPVEVPTETLGIDNPYMTDLG